MDATQTAEEWRPIAGYEDAYEVSSTGRIRSLPRVVTHADGRYPRPVQGRILKQKTQNMGYWQVALARHGLVKWATVHRLACAAFHGPAPHENAVVRHLNGNNQDNRPQNLQWGTYAENSADMIRHGRSRASLTHCKRDHQFTSENTREYLSRKGTMIRVCRACERDKSTVKNRLREARKRADWPTHTCRVCKSSFRNAFPHALFCSEDCRRISRRKEFGWEPRKNRGVA